MLKRNSMIILSESQLLLSLFARRDKHLKHKHFILHILFPKSISN